MASSAEIIDTLKSLTDKLDRLSAHHLDSFDQCETKVGRLSKERTKIILERTREASRILNVRDEVRFTNMLVKLSFKCNFSLRQTFHFQFIQSPFVSLKKLAIFNL